MDARDFFNTHPAFKSNIHNRNYLCPVCGFLRRAPAHNDPEAPVAPRHCDAEMICLYHTHTVAATHLEQSKRVQWLHGGARIKPVGGKRQWRAVL